MFWPALIINTQRTRDKQNSLHVKWCVTVTVVQSHLRSTTITEYIYFTEKDAIKTQSRLRVDKAGDADNSSPRFLLQTVFIALTRKVRTTATPTYLSELVQTHAPSPALRSSNALLLVIPRVPTELTRRTFYVAAPSTCSCWHSTVRKHSHCQTPLENLSALISVSYVYLRLFFCLCLSLFSLFIT